MTEPGGGKWTCRGCGDKNHIDIKTCARCSMPYHYSKIEQPNPKIAEMWRHKKTGKILKVVPWYEIPDPVLELSGNDAKKAFDLDLPRRVKFGTLVQVGWLIENEHNIFIGVGIEAAKEFEPYEEETK